ncbi:hypothetical protein ACKVMT_02875 [Halobacteriales archaeon Cl-PHB]
MDRTQVAPLVGIVGCLAVLAALAYPYIADPAGVTAYYASGVVNPLVAGLLALLAIIVLAAGREDRTDPGFAAGVALVFGLFVFFLVLAWSLTLRVDASTVAATHRWLALASAVLPAVGAGWYARTLGLV